MCVFSQPGECTSPLFVCKFGVSVAWSFRRLIPCVLQVHRDQCGENPTSAASAQAAEGHQQSEGIKGLQMRAAY